MVLVTGGSGGIGAATCRAFAVSGAHVAVNGRRLEPVRAVVDTIEAAGGKAAAVPSDCTDPVEFDDVPRRIEGEFGPINVLCAFAGGGRAPQPVTDIVDDEWRADVDGNLTATSDAW